MNEIEDYKREMNDICEVDNDKYIIPILVDFDGTIVHHKYPFIGEPSPHAIELMCEYTSKYNVGWILNTMRSGDLLEEAVKYIEANGVKLYGIGKNPSQSKWTESPKAYGMFSIDDINIGCPKIYSDNERPYVDWLGVDKELRPILEKIAIG